MKYCDKCDLSMFDRCDECGFCGNKKLICNTEPPITIPDKPDKFFRRSIIDSIDRMVDYDNILIMGQQGSGKTTLAEAIKHNMSDKKGIECHIYENDHVIRERKEESKILAELIANNHNSNKNIIVSQTIMSIPKLTLNSLSNNMVMLTSLSSRLYENIPPLYDKFKKTIDEFYQISPNKTHYRRYLAMTNDEAWIGTY